MHFKYTLEEVKQIVASGKVNTTNLTDIIASLKDVEYNEDIRQIFIGLSNNMNLPEELREKFREVVESYSVIEGKKDEVVLVEPMKETVKPYSNRPVGYREKDDSISLENDVVLGGLIASAATKGIKVLSSDPGLNNNGEISFELDNNSKPYLDNLLLTLHDNKDDINVDMTRVQSTSQEKLTIKVDNPNLSQEELMQKSNEMFNKVNEIITTTDKDKDYESLMPPHLQALKDKFHNDDPNIPDADFTIGYSRENGDVTYYIIADSKEEAIEIAELMGYEIKEDRGGNVFEIDDKDMSLEGSKLDTESINVNEIDEVKETENGISDVPVDYNDKHYGDEEYERIEKFISNTSDPSTMSVIQIDAPDNTPNQRIVTLASEDGTRETIIFNNGKDFDNYTLPKIANAYGQGTTIDSETATKTEYGNGKSSYDALSSDNTYLRVNNFSTDVINNVDNTLSTYKTTNSIEENSYTNSNSYAKKLGTYPTKSNYNEAANTNFLALIIFILVLLIGVGIIYMMFGG